MAGFGCSALGGSVPLLSSKLGNNVPLEAIGEQSEAGRKGKEAETRDNRAFRTAAGGRAINEGSQRHPQQRGADHLPPR